MKVWKFEIADPETPPLMPYGAHVLSVGVQYDKVCVWALVNPLEPVEAHRLVIVPTGETVPGRGRFLGTVMLHGGALVFHVWDRFEP